MSKHLINIIKGRQLSLFSTSTRKYKDLIKESRQVLVIDLFLPKMLSIYWLVIYTNNRN